MKPDCRHTSLTTFTNYTVYGHSKLPSQRTFKIGFNGALLNPLANLYHLGNGHREYSPLLMRFTSPDRFSPFGAGGVNTYAYCSGDPVNRVDPTGTVSLWSRIKGFFGGRRNRSDIAHSRVNAEPITTVSPVPSRQEQQRGAFRFLTEIEPMYPEIFDNIVNHLSPGDLQNAASINQMDVWADKHSMSRYLDYFDAISKGQKVDYRNDGRLNNTDVFNLQYLQDQLLKTELPLKGFTSFIDEPRHQARSQVKDLTKHAGYMRRYLELPSSKQYYLLERF
ncbi:RHS repeat-associated core domain-containing protein [Pseudomonas sp. CM25]|uniref:RHS repeat-associated core domain-containing protein n=1 Tax=Pseudomonas sp. CM25 TaxID=2738448 RepID=UPI001552ECA0|nr:RHS repeat-associated core domain-containing protein [Pseudomonas sp. CM25]NQD56310.1 RHS repeat-associated core domain-containing protein [Pseudomonas sp. CM25]HEN8798499.1 RHS repeat-associated core domain-containing protein [Pseudomonas putida]